ncbi:hypothetical protein NL64_23560 [Pseudomonas fluorescens]|nr:hypothetical protein NL64_23560 [Pseudomonas fluorescens]
MLAIAVSNVPSVSNYRAPSPASRLLQVKKRVAFSITQDYGILTRKGEHLVGAALEFAEILPGWLAIWLAEMRAEICRSRLAGDSGL